MRRATTPLAGAASLALFCMLAAPGAWALRLDEVNIYMEINATDGDAGIQIFLDGEGWDTMQVFRPGGDMVLGVVADGNVGEQGITELFLESAEPSFDEQPFEEFLELFPPGVYVFRGATTDGAVLMGGARLTHRIPEAPEIVLPIEDEAVDPADTVIEWETVPHPTGGRIKGYEVIVAREEPFLRVFSAFMGHRQNRVTVPAEFMQHGREYKVEVIAVEKSGNRTISELEFETD